MAPAPPPPGRSPKTTTSRRRRLPPRSPSTPAPHRRSHPPTPGETTCWLHVGSIVDAAVAPARCRCCLVAVVDVAVDVAVAAAIAFAIAVAIAAAIAIAAHTWQALLLVTLPSLEEQLARPRVEEAAPIHAHPVHFGGVPEVPEHRTLTSEDVLAESSGGAAPRATPKAARVRMGR